MKKTIALLSGLALLAGCTSLDRLKKAEPQGGEFNNALAAEYLAFAESEAEQYDWLDSDYFARKGLKAAYGQEVAAEDASRWNIAGAEHVAELNDAKTRLESFLSLAKTANPARAARAQLLYDCWVEQQEEGWQKNDIAACRDEFNSIVGGPVSPGSVVYFDLGSSAVNKAGRAVIDSVAKALKGIDVYKVTLKGHTDRVGNDKANQALSQKRVSAVKEALVSKGVKRKSIATEFYGETVNAVPTQDNVKEPRNRRVEIQAVKIGNVTDKKASSAKGKKKADKAAPAAH